MKLYKTRNPEFFSFYFPYILSPMKRIQVYGPGYQGLLPDFKNQIIT